MLVPLFFLIFANLIFVILSKLRLWERLKPPGQSVDRRHPSLVRGCPAPQIRDGTSPRDDARVLRRFATRQRLHQTASRKQRSGEVRVIRPPACVVSVFSCLCTGYMSFSVSLSTVGC